MISDCLHHDTVAVHLFQRCLIKYLKVKFSSAPVKIFYFSDGAASQYKNSINLCHHVENLVFLLSGIFQLLHMEKERVMELGEQ